MSRCYDEVNPRGAGSDALIMGDPRVTTALTCLVIAGLLVAGAMITLASPGEPASSDRATPSARHPSQVVTRSVPRHGDCGDRRGAGVEPVACSDPRADVEVGARRALGDPAAACPLYDRGIVLVTQAGVGSLYVCWVPMGGGPSRTAGSPDLERVVTTEPDLVPGVCGDVHDLHVHAPLSCDEDRADGVVISTAPAADRCPDGTLLALPVTTEAVVCWGPRDA